MQIEINHIGVSCLTHTIFVKQEGEIVYRREAVSLREVELRFPYYASDVEFWGQWFPLKFYELIALESLKCK